jgi:hypothetical protein
MLEEVNKLRETLATLHAELATVEAHDPEVRNMLAGALQDIADKLSAREAGLPIEPPNASAGAELAETARQFEVDHPTLAATLRSLVESLSRMGI